MIEPSGIRLQRLIETQISQIIRRERKNVARIYLYETGDYWIAFERSAYSLCRLFPEADISVVMLRDNPFPIILANISEKKLCHYAKQHIFYRDTPDYKEIATAEIPLIQYNIWHRQAVLPYINAI